MNRTIRRRTALVICVGLMAASGFAQDQPDPQAPAPRHESPFGVRSVELSAIYSSQNIPAGIRTFADPFPLGSAAGFGASGFLQWLKSGRQSVANVSYLPGYRMQFQNGTAKGLNQSLSMLFSRRSRHSKWRFTASGDGSIMSFDEALLSPTKYGRLVSSGAELGALSDAVLQGNTTDPNLTDTTGFAPDMKLERFLVGSRTQFAGGQIGVHGSPSRRLTIGVTAGASEVRHVQDSQDIAGFRYPSVTEVSLSSDTTYSLTRHSTFGGTVDVGQSESTILRNTSSSAKLFYKERLRRYWFFELSGGAGHNSAAAAGQGTYIYSGGAGFESFQHTAMVYFSRNITGAYVIALGPTSAAYTTVSAAWQWHPNRARWSFLSDFTYFRDAPPHQPPPHTWQVNETLGRRIGRAYTVQVQAAMGKLGSRRYIQDGRLYQLRQNALRASFVWYPSRAGSDR